jgi:hypothetical protein
MSVNQLLNDEYSYNFSEKYINHNAMEIVLIRNEINESHLFIHDKNEDIPVTHTYNDIVKDTRFWSTKLDYYLEYPRIQNVAVCDMNRSDCKAKVYNKSCKHLFDANCNRYKADIAPFFFTHKKETYLFTYPRYGEYELLNMQGVVVAKHKTKQTPITFCQRTDNELVLKSLDENDNKVQIKIFIEESIENCNVSEFVYTDDNDKNDLIFKIEN